MPEYQRLQSILVRFPRQQTPPSTGPAGIAVNNLLHKIREAKANYLALPRMLKVLDREACMFQKAFPCLVFLFSVG